MSKRHSTNQSNTILNYFQSPKGKSNNNEEKPKVKSEPNQSVKHSNDSSDDELPISQSKKRSRIMVMDSDSDSDTDMNPTKKQTKSSNSTSSEEDSPGDNSEKSTLHTQFSFCGSPAQKTKPKKETTSQVISDVRPLSLSDIKCEDPSKWLHQKLGFLEPGKIRDANRNRPSDENYDPKTLYVPEDYLDTLTPAMRQWWNLKSKHMDSIIFFKVGKFYELYHMDATVGVNHLGFSYMKGDFAHSGFPETAYGRMAASLIDQGFKVARVEQTETPEMMAERCKGLRKPTKYDKVVKREICQISTRGACIYGAQLTDAKQPLPVYMLAICEKSCTTGPRYGVCFIDTSIGIFHLAEFDDDRHSSRLLALLAEHPPALILVERNRGSKNLIELLNKFTNVKIDALIPETQFYSASKTVETLSRGCYFLNKKEELDWPPIFNQLLQNDVVKKEYTLSVRALGACIWYLKDCELDLQVIAMGKFEFHHPIDTLTYKKTNSNRDYMVLDSVTIENLKLISGAGSLMKTLDHCCTPFGKRLLQHWICRPFCDPEKIKDRQDAVKELLENLDLLQKVRSILTKMPDLERQVSKIHTFGNKFCAKLHPDSRAILYEMKIYSKRKILDLLSTLKGFEETLALPDIFENCQSRLLRKLTQFEPKGILHDLNKVLQYFKEAFDQKEAEKEGKIIPQSGIDQEYDDIIEEIQSIESEAEDYLKDECKKFGCKIVYFGSDKKRFQLEIPENKSHKVDDGYQLEGTKKGSNPAKRYSTTTTKNILAKLIKAETEKSRIVQDLNRRIFEKFSERYNEWNDVIQCVMMLDCLCSFAEYARNYSQDICLPTVLPFSQNRFLKITNGRHPCINMTDSFVPNDTEMGTEDFGNLIVLTGPNMGGKSTLMRQVALIIIMAQLGSYVPAESCELTAVDRIFTRLGAHDDILKKQSTFFVELSEASAILKHASEHSFVLLDELGRGTSTHDGCAIATAYVQKLQQIKCRTIFSTHYHTLVEYFHGKEDIQLAHMACMVENEGDLTEECVIFLYKLAKGSCPKSYGFNVAKLAGVPPSIVKRAHTLAINMEKICRNRKILKKCLDAYELINLKNLRKVLLSH